MKSLLLLTASGPLLILTSHESLHDPKLLEELKHKGIGKFDPEHFGIERNVVVYTSAPALRELDRLRRRWRARQAGRLPSRRPPSLSYLGLVLMRGGVKKLRRYLEPGAAHPSLKH